MCCRTSRAIPRPWPGWRAAYLESGDLERAKTTLQMVPPDAAQDEAIRAVEAELKLREAPVPENGETAALRARLAADPKDHQARFDLAMALDAGGDRDGGAGRTAGAGAARPQMERGCGAQAAGYPVRSHGTGRSAHHRGAAQAFGHLVLLMPRHYHSYTDLPKSLPLFPLTGAVLLPRGQLPLNIFEPRYLAMVDMPCRATG